MSATRGGIAVFASGSDAEVMAEGLRVECRIELVYSTTPHLPSPDKRPCGLVQSSRGSGAGSRQGCSRAARSSNPVMASMRSRVRSMSSSPSIRQRLRNASISKWIVRPSGSVMVSADKSTVSVGPGAARSRSRSLPTSASGRVIVNSPFFAALAAKMSPKLGAITHRIPPSTSP
jgi:hypothetical protein